VLDGKKYASTILTSITCENAPPPRPTPTSVHASGYRVLYPRHANELRPRVILDLDMQVLTASPERTRSSNGGRTTILNTTIPPPLALASFSPFPNIHKEHSTNPHQPYPSLPLTEPLHYPSYPEEICICLLHTVALDGEWMEKGQSTTPDWVLTGSHRAQERVIRLQWVVYERRKGTLHVQARQVIAAY
jgi:hypothetical protein